MQLRKPFIVLLSVLASLHFSPAESVQANPDCPPDTLWLTLQPNGNPPGIPFETLATTEPATTIWFSPFSGYCEAQYDLITATSTAISSYGLGARLSLSDTYVLTGLPDGTPVDITAQLAAVFTVSDLPGAGRQVIGWIELESGPEVRRQAYTFADGTVGHSFEVALLFDISIVAGQPFGLRWRMLTDSDQGEISITSTLSFLDIPEGTVVTSCQGFQQNRTSGVPVQALSWGSLKNLYR